LIQIKAPCGAGATVAMIRRSTDMPIENALILAAIVLTFIVFGVVVASVDVYSRRRPDQQPAE
jgi:hypothetical protein